MTTDAVSGNLMSYKIYLRPMARKMYGHSKMTCTKHQESIQNMLRILFVNGAGTTWDMARTRLYKTIDVRKQEKIFRRLLVGRYDRGRYSKGIVNMGIVVREKSTTKPYSVYRLSIFGILYYIDAFDPTHKEIDSMALKYAAIIPKVFGRWNQNKKILGSYIYNIKILAKGIYLNNSIMQDEDSPIYELMSYIHIKYKKNFENMEEKKLAEQISWWFYTFLLYGGKTNILKKILAQNNSIGEWYREFFYEAARYYKERFSVLNKSQHILDTIHN